MSTHDLTDLVYDEMHATRWDLADWELRELAQTAVGVLRSHPCDHEAQIRDLLEEREELLTEIRRLRMGNHPAGRALLREDMERQLRLVADAVSVTPADVLALREALTERDAGHEETP